MIAYKKGDLLVSDETVVAHGCNCSGGFGSGFAAQVARLYPSAREAYINKHNRGGWILGQIQPVCVADGKRIIVNCSTQQRYGRPDEGPYVSYPAVRAIVRELLRAFPQGFAMPKIGAGLAGGNWDIIAKIVEEESGEVEVRVYELPDVVGPAQAAAPNPRT